MYLDTLDPLPPSQKYGIGYQVFNLEPKYLTFSVIDPDPTEVCHHSSLLGYCHEYLADQSHLFTCNLEQEWPGKTKLIRAPYNAGFHIWKNKEDAAQHLYWLEIMTIAEPGLRALREVHYTRAFATGTIEGCPIVMAASISIQQLDVDNKGVKLYRGRALAGRLRDAI